MYNDYIRYCGVDGMKPIIIKGFFFGLLKYDISTLREYVSEVEDYLRNKTNEYEKHVEEVAKGVADEDIDDFYMSYADEYHKLNEIFPSTLRTSLFISSYSLLEYRLNHLCKLLQKEKGITIDLEKLKASDQSIGRAHSYLVNEAGITFPDSTPHWKNIKVYQKIRNNIVHYNGILQRDLHIIEPYAKQNPNLVEIVDEYSHKRIKLSKDFCPQVISDLDALFTDLGIELGKVKSIP